VWLEADDPDVMADGRLARGHRRRIEIIAKTLEVVERDGVAGVSHRAVARELGVSPSALTHHFATLDDLLTAALVSALLWTEEHFAGLRSVDDLVDLLETQMGQRKRLAAVYELYLLAARRPVLREAARGWERSLMALARRLGAGPDGELALVAAVDGLGLRALLFDVDVPRETIRKVVARALAGEPSTQI